MSPVTHSAELKTNYEGKLSHVTCHMSHVIWSEFSPAGFDKRANT